MQCDKSRFEQVLLSMLISSIDNAAAGSLIQVECWTEELAKQDITNSLLEGVVVSRQEKRQTTGHKLELKCKV